MSLRGHDEWKTTEPTPEPNCPTCHDSGECADCGGRGCKTCFGSGQCVECLSEEDYNTLKDFSGYPNRDGDRNDVAHGTVKD